MDTAMNEATVRGAGPLYAQVIDLLTARLASGAWQPGQMIPAENRLATELRVSQGTVRKAVDELVARNLLVRQQGVGTFVSVHDTHRALFHFFNIVAPSGSKILPDSEVLRSTTNRASREEAETLAIAPQARVVRIERLRHMSGQPTIVESVSVAAQKFPGLTRLREIPNTLYELYERKYGITVHRAEEQLSAEAASARDARLLGCPEGHPLLKIVRVAWSVDTNPIELRVSRCLTTQHRYHNSIL